MNSSLDILGQSLSILELLGVASGLLGVWLTTIRSIYCFPVGILNVIIYALIFFGPDVRLYADGGLQLCFGVLLTAGWVNWARKNNLSKTEITGLSKHDIIRLALISVPAGFLSGEILTRTDAAYPRLDAWLATFSLVAQWLIAKKKIENWILWIAVNTIYVPVYWYRGLPATSMLYSLYLLLAIKGFLSWRRSLTSKIVR
ncbi:MAG: nicotinamide riboside transporter PnuC [Bacteroidota bacterium]